MMDQEIGIPCPICAGAVPVLDEESPTTCCLCSGPCELECICWECCRVTCVDCRQGHLEEAA